MAYTWKVMLTGAQPQQGQQRIPLEDDLNALEDQGYETYTILPLEKAGVAFAIVARKSAERARRDSLARASRRARRRTMRSIPRS